MFTNHIQRNSSSWQIKKSLLTGFGNIWFTYFIEAPYAVSLSFVAILTKTTRKNKLMPYFLLRGVFNKIKAVIKN